MNRSKYPADWEQISARIRFERANGKCERCGAKHGAIGARDINDKWHDVDDIDAMNSDYGGRLFDGEYPHIIKIILTCAHLNHDTTDNSDTNLAALCQLCHNRHDIKYRVQNRRHNHDRVVGQLRMFEEATE